MSCSCLCVPTINFCADLEQQEAVRKVYSTNPRIIPMVFYLHPTTVASGCANGESTFSFLMICGGFIPTTNCLAETLSHHGTTKRLELVSIPSHFQIKGCILILFLHTFNGLHFVSLFFLQIFTTMLSLHMFMSLSLVIAKLLKRTLQRDVETIA